MAMPEKSSAAIAGYCCCNNGTTLSYAIGPENPCDAFCNNNGGVQANVSYDPAVNTPSCPNVTAPGGSNFDNTLPSGQDEAICGPGMTYVEDAEGYGTCIPGGDSNIGPGGSNFDSTRPSGGGGTFSLPNFIGARTVSELIAKLAKFIIALAIPFAVVMLIWAGFLFATAQGNEEKINKAKRNFLWTIAGVALILASEALISYIEEILGGSGASRVTPLIDRIKDLANQVISLLFVLVTVYFFWGVIEYVRAGGEEEAVARGKKHMIWGIIGMTIMASAWGIVELIKNFVQ